MKEIRDCQEKQHKRHHPKGGKENQVFHFWAQNPFRPCLLLRFIHGNKGLDLSVLINENGVSIGIGKRNKRGTAGGGIGFSIQFNACGRVLSGT